MRSKDAQIQFAVEERDFLAVGGRRIAMGLGDAVDQALQAEAPQVIRHLCAGVRPPEQRFDLGAEIAVTESSREMGETGDRLQECHDAWVAEAESRGALAGFHGRGLESVERLLGEDALLTHALDFQELAIDLVTEIAEMGEVGDAFVGVESSDC